MIHLTRTDGTPIDVSRDEIVSVEPIGEVGVIHLKEGPPIRVLQSASWVVALWKQNPV